MTGSERGEDGEPGGRMPRAQYANHLSIEFSMSEVALRFGQRADPSSPPVINSNIVSSPVDLISFGHEIQATILRYERLYGRIPDPSGPGPDATRQ